MKSRLDQLLELRKHHSFGKVLTPLISHIPDDSAIPPLPDPSQTGTLNSTEINVLYEIAIYSVTKWQLDAQYNKFDSAEFTGFVNLKTTQEPSYYTVYLQTIALYQSLEKQLGKIPALEYLYTPNPISPPTNWEEVRNWSIQEYLNLMITSGNFKTYGWVNYPGWMGGPYNNSSDLPYRT